MANKIKKDGDKYVIELTIEKPEIVEAARSMMFDCIENGGSPQSRALIEQSVKNMCKDFGFSVLNLNTGDTDEISIKKLEVSKKK